MSSFFIFMGASFIISLIFLVAFVWSVKDGQYDDITSPSVRILNESSEPSDIKKP